MNWKKQLSGGRFKVEETREQLIEHRNQLVIQCGQNQFTKAVMEAELLQANQKILDINNKLQKMPAEAKAEAPEVVPPEAPKAE
jgi:hypothetical protein